MDYAFTILAAYGITLLLMGGLILQSWLAARRATRALQNALSRDAQ